MQHRKYINYNSFLRLPNKLMSIDLRSTGNGTHSNSPNAIHVAQCTTAQIPLHPSGKCSDICKDASSIYIRVGWELMMGWRCIMFIIWKCIYLSLGGHVQLQHSHPTGTLLFQQIRILATGSLRKAGKYRKANVVQFAGQVPSQRRFTSRQ